jgi:hypothetical protein
MTASGTCGLEGVVDVPALEMKAGEPEHRENYYHDHDQDYDPQSSHAGSLILQSV